MKPEVRMIGLTQVYHDPDYDEPLPLTAPRDLIEFAGRWDYGETSVAKMVDEGHEGVIKRWLDSGEESMVEMLDAIFLVTCSRVVSHELVRHRIASYQQESQRFVKYEDADQFDLMYVPVPEDSDPNILKWFDAANAATLGAYKMLVKAGVPKQLARYVLPNATRTRIIVKMNVREFRHVLRLRMHTSAQPEMQLIAGLIHGKLQRALGPDLFPDDIAAKRGAR
jgi:thymidylate synthase (FAD)